MLPAASHAQLKAALALPGMRVDVRSTEDALGLEVQARWLVGETFAGLATFRIEHAVADELDFHALRFEPDFQGRGFYTRLRRQLAAWASANGIAHARASSTGAARSTLLRSGFRASDGDTLLVGSAADLAR